MGQLERHPPPYAVTVLKVRGLGTGPHSPSAWVPVLIRHSSADPTHSSPLLGPTYPLPPSSHSPSFLLRARGGPAGGVTTSHPLAVGVVHCRGGEWH